MIPSNLLELQNVIEKLKEKENFSFNIKDNLDIPKKFIGEFLDIFSEKYKLQISNLIPELNSNFILLKTFLHRQYPGDFLLMDGDNFKIDEIGIYNYSLGFLFTFVELPKSNNKIIFNFQLEYQPNIDNKRLQIIALGSKLNNNLLDKRKKNSMSLRDLFSKTDTSMFVKDIKNYSGEKYYFSSILKEDILGNSFLELKRQEKDLLNLHNLVQSYLEK
jgi:hypothetical protein